MKKYFLFLTCVVFLFFSCSNTVLTVSEAEAIDQNTPVRQAHSFAQELVTHPSSGSFSPVDCNGTNEGLGWEQQAWALGAHIASDGSGTTFAVYSQNATRILLEIYDSASGQNAIYDYWMSVGSDNIWRAKINGAQHGSIYAFRVWGANWTYSSTWQRGGSTVGFVSDVDAAGNRFNPNKVLFDPYGREMTHDKSNPVVLGNENAGMFGTGSDLYGTSARRTFDTGKWAPKSIVISDATSFGTKPLIPPQDAAIYEVHVRGLTQHESSASLTSILQGFDGFENVQNIPAAYRGTYKGAGMMAPYLKALGINTVELLPVHESDNDANPDSQAGGNFWGYMTYGYFAPDRRYSFDKSYGGPTSEFKAMVKTFHDAGIEVYLDVVYNHSGEGGTWANTNTAELTFLRGFDNSQYYALAQDKASYWETTGCGNNLRCDNPVVRALIIDSLKYWLDEMGVDGFRFDLAPVLGRVQSGSNWVYQKNAQTIIDIQQLGVNENAEMIAEAWDTAAYEVGNFPASWGEWNGKYRDAVRKFINTGDTSGAGGLSYADAFYGSYNDFNDQGGPHKSVNFITAHDGFTLADVVSYANKNNSGAFPFGVSDGGSDNNDSTDSEQDQALRRQRIRNFITFMTFSRGVPMIVYGDEFGRTQNGNNNVYNLDSVATWNNYTMINTNTPQAVSTGTSGSYHNNIGTFGSVAGVNAQFVFMRNVLQIRANDSVLRQNNYSVPFEYRKNDMSTEFNSNSDRCVWIRIKGSQVPGGSDYLLFVNMWTDTIPFTVPQAVQGKKWVRIIDTQTYFESNANSWTESTASTIAASTTYGVPAWSITVLKQITQ